MSGDKDYELADLVPILRAKQDTHFICGRAADEIERKYFDIAVERIDAAYAQGRLFA